MKFVFRIGETLTLCEGFSQMIGDAVQVMSSHRVALLRKFTETGGMYGSVEVDKSILLDTPHCCILYMGRGSVLKEVGHIKLCSEGIFTFDLEDVC